MLSLQYGGAIDSTALGRERLCQCKIQIPSATFYNAKSVSNFGVSSTANN